MIATLTDFCLQLWQKKNCGLSQPKKCWNYKKIFLGLRSQTNVCDFYRQNICSVTNCQSKWINKEKYYLKSLINGYEVWHKNGWSKLQKYKVSKTRCNFLVEFVSSLFPLKWRVDCFWIEIADERLRFLQTKHLQCTRW